MSEPPRDGDRAMERERARRVIPVDKALAKKLAERAAQALSEMLSEVPFEDVDTGLPDREAVEVWAEKQRGVMTFDGLRVRSREIGGYGTRVVTGKATRHVAVFVDLYYVPRAPGLLKAWVGGETSSWIEIHVVCNIAHYEAPELRDHPTAYEANIESKLLHEMTHARDVIRERDAVALLPPGTDDERSLARYRQYFNSSHEVRAYAQQIVSESLRPAVVLWAQHRAQTSRTPNATIVEEVVERSPTWQRVSRFWTERSKQRVLLAVAQALAEGGHLYERPRGAPVPLPRRKDEW
jgi:hypothetical protein